MEEPLKEEKNVVILSRGLDTSCAIHLQGATITSWRILGVEQLFVGSQERYKGIYPIRGGISLAFPFYQAWNFGPRYGSARLVRWYQFIEPFRHCNGDVECAFIVPSTSFSRSMFSHLCWLAVWIVLCERELHVRYYVFNVNTDFPFFCSPMLMVSLRFDDVQDITISGLQHCMYTVDKYGTDNFIQKEELLTISEFIHQVYIETPDLVIDDPMSHRRIIIIKDVPETAVWNPWDGEVNEVCFHDLTPEHEGFDEDEFFNMLRLSFGCMERPVHLEPNQHFVGRIILQVEDTRGVQDPCKVTRLVPARPSIEEEPHLPHLGLRLQSIHRADKSISEKAEPSLTDVPYMVVEELIAGASKYHPDARTSLETKRTSLDEASDIEPGARRLLKTMRRPSYDDSSQYNPAARRNMKAMRTSYDVPTREGTTHKIEQKENPRTDVANFSFLNRTMTDWNSAPPNASDTLLYTVRG